MDKTGIKNNYVKTPTVFQIESTECGAASLAMVLGYYGRYISLEQLRADCGIGRDGSSVKSIKQAAKKHGLTARAFIFSAETIHTVKLPAILYWRFSHYVVFEGYKNGYYYINDPAQGRKKLSFEEFKADFSRVTVEIEKTEDFVPNRKVNALANEIRERMRSDRKSFVQILILGLVLVFPGVLIPMFSKAYVDRILVNGEFALAGTVLFAMLMMLLFRALFSFIRMKVMVELQTKLKLTSGYLFLDHLFKLPIRFFEQRLPGALTNRVENNNRVSDFTSGDLLNMALDIFIAGFFFIVMLIYSPFLTLIGIIGVAVNIIFGRIFSNRLDTMAMKSQTEQAKLTGSCFVAVTALETVKASGEEKNYLSTILGSYAENSNSLQKVSRSTEVLLAVPQAITRLFEALILLVGAYLVIRGRITAGILVAFSELLVSFTQPMNTLIGFFSRLKVVKADVTCVNDIMNYEIAPKYRDVKEKADVEQITGEVVFKNVSFGYVPFEAPLIENLSFTVKPGKTLALVGSSGSGKSTIGKLANGLLIPWSGEILYDGIPIDKTPEHIFSYYVATASQNISMFSGTVRDNLTLWNDSILEDRILRAAKDACIHDTIVRLPDAYNASVKENGANFSGGERQRLEIARALTTNPSVVILDEATSALDPIVEQQVMTNIRKRGCTCIIIAHRLSTIRDCDEILVLDHGRIVQRGTHEEMKDLPGRYRELISME